MNWDAISAVGELLGAAGVIGSLVYLSVQIRHNSAEVRHASADRVVELYTTNITKYADDSSLAELIARLNIEGFDALSPGEQMRIHGYYGRSLRVMEAIHWHSLEGTIDAEIWEGLDTMGRDLLNAPALREYWELRKHWFSKRYQDYVGRIASGPPPAYLGKIATAEQEAQERS
ncbi:MAG: hypothetical protein V2I66_00535 [Halieaceae bacterium]|jgi:hypothetical protein|nr:hypothetical protein [Halieaceae bacterium]